MHKLYEVHEDDKNDAEWQEIITQVNEEYDQHAQECLEYARKWKIFRLNKIDIQEAYSELYRVSIHLLNYTSGDIIDKSITIFKSWDRETILSSETGHKLLAEIDRIDLDRSEIMILNESKHNENIANIKRIFNQLIATVQEFNLSEKASFTYESAYEELYKVILIMIRSLMSDVIDYNILWNKYEHHYKKVRYLSRKRARKIIKKCDKRLASEVYIPVTYADQDMHLKYFGKIFKKIRTCPKDCFRYFLENDKREVDFERWAYE